MTQGQYSNGIKRAVELIEAENIDKRNGLPEDLFLCISSLIVIANVDLFIIDGRGRILLSYRDDEFYGKGWHIPGGCLRFGETMLERVHKTAHAELGIDVLVEPTPIAIRDVIRQPLKGAANPDVRGHNLAVLFKCRLGDEKDIPARFDSENIKWFERIPEDILSVHSVYNDILGSYGLL